MCDVYGTPVITLNMMRIQEMIQRQQYFLYGS